MELTSRTIVELLGLLVVKFTLIKYLFDNHCSGHSGSMIDPWLKMIGLGFP